MLGIAIFSLAVGIGQGFSFRPPAFIWNEDTQQAESVPLPFEDTNPSRVSAGELYQSDILLTEEQWASLRGQRKAIASTSSRWTEGSDGYPLVPYVFVDAVNKDDVRSGLDHWMENTCIKFEKTSNKDQPHLKFHIGTGCWSYIGMIAAWKGQDISIGSGCNSLGTIVHEVGHAMGFFHEQSRSDRDDYVKILTENIQDGKEGNFDKSADNNYNVPYDYTSNMHYGMDYFTKNGDPTIVTLDPLVQGLIGSRNGLTHRDKLLANRMYGCIGKWLTKCSLSSDPCKNDGYTGADCSCVCPPGTSGDKCETVTSDYYADKISGRNEKITTEKEMAIITPMSAGESFVKWIIPPTCKSAKLTITEERMYTGDCYFQSVNVKKSLSDYSGKKYCREDLSVGTKITSDETIILTFNNRVSYSFERTLLKADITFEDISGCTPPETTPAPPVGTEGPDVEVLPCVKKGKTIKIPKGESRLIQSPNFPEDYPKKSSCSWKLKADKKGKLSIKCDTFSLGSKSGLKIGKQSFTGDGPVQVDDASGFKIKFKGKKPGRFSCLVTSYKN